MNPLHGQSVRAPRSFSSRRPRGLLSAAAVLGLAMPASAGSITIDFDDLVHGEIVSNQYLASHGLTISADNFSRSFDLVGAFDTTKTHTRDPDLEDPWSGGNIPTRTHLGRALIIQENNQMKNGLLKYPDDEGRRPAGTLTFAFLRPIDLFGFDLIDVEGPVQEAGKVSFYLGAALLGEVDFLDFVTPGSYYDSTIAFGNHTANRIAPITAADIGAGGFDRVVVRLGGSGAVDNVVIPEPASALFLGLGLFAGLSRRRRLA